MPRLPGGVRLAQRRCACGGVPGPDGECAACRQKRLSRQHLTAPATAAAVAPPIVHEALNGPGQPLDGLTRATMEPRLGHDFSQVRVHTDARAAASARAVHALAYTVGQHVVFGHGQYAPRTPSGQRLLAHELSHVVQQTGAGGQTAGGPLAVGEADAAAEREADAAAERAVSGRTVGIVTPVARLVQRAAEPYISNVAVNLSAPQGATLEWKGTPPADAPGSDKFTVSTGKGYSDPDDEPGTCLRSCCGGADTQCAEPYDQPKKVGACCTPIGTFYTGKTRPEHNGWKYWTPVEPVHTAYGRGIALHQHTEVTGEAIGHGCIRMDEANAHRIALYARGKETKVTISGKAKVSCPTDRQCGATTGQGAMNIAEPAADTAVATLSAPDSENPGASGGAELVPAQTENEVSA